MASFKKITTVPSANELLDICLSRTQRRTPTQIHRNFKISRIRGFYARKVKFTESSFVEKLEAIISEFPKLSDAHPFHADLFNILYDRDHFKIALSQLSTAKNLIEGVARDYLRLMKYGDSLYRCKQLKRAALGRMANIVRRQKEPLAYLEQVRQHLARLPSIDPNTRTLIICGYPNVGKSSFMNKITRANVDVQPYAFTTKSLFVGHFDYKYLRWQAIDTPGILDHPLEEMNTIEMQSITALAHLRACVLYFMDLSEQCGYTIEAQVNLFHSIKPLFANKVTLLVINKVDITTLESLDPASRALLQTVLDSGEIELVQVSCHSDIGVANVKQAACDRLLASRVEAKLRGGKINDVLHKIRLAMPAARDDQPRPPCIPEEVLQRKLYNWTDPNRRKLEKDNEVEAGGAGRYSKDLRKHYLLDSDEWKHDTMPELIDGKNVFDYLDPDIEARLDALEKEEEMLEADGFYRSDDEIEDDEQAALLAEAARIRQKHQLMRNRSRLNKHSLSSRRIMMKRGTRGRIGKVIDLNRT